MRKILCYIYEGMADFETSLLLHILNNSGKFEIISISETRNTITALTGLQYTPHKIISEINTDDYEALIIPGGAINNDQNEICSTVNKMILENKLVSAICFAPQFLGRAGVLDNYKFTTSCSPEKINSLNCSDLFNWNNYIDKRVVVDRNIITAKGHAFVDFAEKICDYLNVFKSSQEKYEKIGRVKESI